MAGRFSVEAVFKAIDRVSAPVTRMQNRVGKFTRKMARGLRNVNKTLGRMTLGLRRAAVAGVGGLTVAVAGAALALKGMADKADALAKRARRLQFPIEELQEWQFVAEQSGISSEMFDKSLEKFTKTVGEARAGTGTLITILKKSNPELLKQVTSAGNVSEAFDIYIKALRGTKNQMDKTALATAAFGRTGAKFINITDQSAKAIRNLRAEQRENGIITRQQAENAEAWNDALNSLKKSLIGLRDTVIAPLLPKLTEYARKMREIIVQNRELISERILTFLRSIRDNFQDIVKWAKRIGIAIGIFLAFAAVMKTLAAVLGVVNLVMAANPITLIVLGVVALIAAFGTLIVFIDDVVAAFDNMSGVAFVLLTPIRLLLKAIKFIKDNFGVVGKIASTIGGILGFTSSGEEDTTASFGPEIVSPQDRLARSIEERRETSTADVTIRDETGRAEMRTKGPLTGINLQLVNSGSLLP